MLALVLLFAVNPAIDKIDYQKVADKAPWTFSEEKASLESCVKLHLGAYDVRIVAVKDRDMTVRVIKDRQELATFSGHSETALACAGDMLFVSEHSPISNGCELQPAWKVRLKGLGPIPHSKYRNQVNVEADGKVVTVWGKEASGRYVEIIDAKTGKMLGHKVFK